MTQSLSNTPDQSAIDAVNLSRIRAAQEKFNSQNGALRSTFARAERQGLHLSAAKRALKVIKSGKSGEMIEEMTKTLEYLRVLGKPVEFGSNQLDLFTSGPAPEDEKAANEGLAAGRGGDLESTNPYEIGSAKGQAWLNSYRQGLSDRNTILAMQKKEDEDADHDYDEGEEDADESEED